MDDAGLIEKITMEVLRDLKRVSSNDFSRKEELPASSTGLGKAVLLFEGNDASKIINTLSGSYSYIEILTPKENIKIGDESNLKVKVTRCYGFDHLNSYLDGGFDFVIYAETSSKIAQIALITSNSVFDQFALKAASLGKKVVIYLGFEEDFAPYRKKIESYISDLCEYGFTVKYEFKGHKEVIANNITPCEDKCDPASCKGCGLCVDNVKNKVQNVVTQGAQRISSTLGVKSFSKELAGMIDHTLLKPEATRDDVVKLCEEARQYSFASVCVNPGFVSLSADLLKGSPVKVCTVVGFPLGATTSVTKAMETRDAIANGATEIDMVINVGALKTGDYELVKKDIQSVVSASGGNIVKVIIEAALLSDDEKVMACKLAKEAGADFVKTSTGFGPGGAKASDIALMRKTVGNYMGVKASGGIRDFKAAKEMVDAGATRVGASASVSIVKGDNGKGDGY